MTTILKEIYNSGLDSNTSEEALSLIRKDAAAEGLSNHDVDKALGIAPFDTSTLQEYMVDKARATFGEDGGQFTRDLFTLDDFFEAGFGRSVSSLAVSEQSEFSKRVEKMPNQTVLQKGTSAIGTIVGDMPAIVPAMIATGIGSAGNVPLSFAAGFAMPEILRHAMIDAYENGDINSFSRFWESLSGTAMAGLKSYVTGFATGGVSSVVGPLAKKVLPGTFLPTTATTAAEIGTFTTVGATLDGRIPDSDEFLVGAVAVGGLKGAQKIAEGTVQSAKTVRNKFEKVYAENNKRPLDVMEDIKTEPTIKEDMNSVNIDVPRVYQTVEQNAKSTNNKADPLSPETIKFQKSNNEKVNATPLDAFGELSLEKIMSEAKDLDFLSDTYSRLLKDHGYDVLHPSERTLLKRWVENSMGDITKIDHLFVPLKEPLVIYHGSSTTGLNKQVSGSLAPDVGYTRADKNYGELHRIVVPAGTRVAFPSKTTNIKALQNELEVVIHPENKIEISRDRDLQEPQTTFEQEIETVEDPARRAFLKQTAGTAAAVAMKKVVPFSELVPLPKKVVAADTSIISLIPREGISGGDAMSFFLPRSAAIKEMKQLGINEKDFEVLTFHKDSAVKTWEEFSKSLDQTSMRDMRDIIVINDKNEILVDIVKNNKEFERAIEQGDEWTDYIHPKYVEKGWDVIDQADAFHGTSLRKTIEFDRDSIEELAEARSTQNKQETIEEIYNDYVPSLLNELHPNTTKIIVESLYAEVEAAAILKHGEGRLAGAGSKDVQLEAPTETPALEAPTETPALEVPTKTPALEAPKLNIQRIGDAKVVRRDDTTEVSNRISVDQPSNTKRPYGLHELYRDIFDDLHPLARVVKDITGGKKLPANLDPYVLARNLKGVSGVGDSFLEFGALDYVTKSQIGESFRDIVRPIDQRGDLQAFREYAISKRVMELSKRPDSIETSVDPVMANNVVKAGKAKFEKDFQRLRVYQESILKYVHDSGMLSKDQFEAMKEANKDYVPFHRVMDAGKSGGSGLRGGTPSSLKKMRGSERMIIDPIESIMRNTYVLTTLAERNRVMDAVVELAETKPELNYIARKKAATTATTIKNKELQKILEPYLKDESINLGEQDLTIFRKKVFINENNIVRYKDGKPEVYEVDPLLIEALGAMDRATLDATVKVLALPASLLRSGAVLSPDFMGRNAVRDTIQASLYSKDGFIPVIDTMRGLGHVLGRTKAYQEWVASGGQFAHLQSIDRSYHQKGMKEMLQSIPVRNVLKNPIEQLRALSGLIEQSTRVKIFEISARKARKRGVPNIEAVTEAAFKAREITLDFQKFGAKTRSLNAMSAFFNAFAQSQAKLASSFKENPVAMTAKVFAGLVMPSALLHLVNRDEEWYKEKPQWERDLYWMVEVNDIIYRIPKPFELGLIFGTGTENFIEYMIAQDNRSATEFLKSLSKSIVPNMMPQALSVPIEVWADKSMFLNRPIIPRDREGMLPEYQYSLHTSETAKIIGAVVGALPLVGESKLASPSVVEHIVRGWTGGLGKYALDAIDQALLAVGLTPENIDPTPQSLTNIPLVKAFVSRYPSLNTKSIERFYNEYARREKYLKSIKGLIKEGRVESAMQLAEMSVQTNNIIRLSGFKKAMSNLSLMVRNIHRLSRMEGMSDEQLANWKRENIDKLYIDMNNVAKMGLQLVEELDKSKID